MANDDRTTVQCPHCGVMMDPAARFCPGCGEPRTSVRDTLRKAAELTGAAYEELLAQARAEAARNPAPLAYLPGAVEPPKRSRLRLALFGAGGLLGMCVLLGIVAAVVGGDDGGDSDAGAGATVTATVRSVAAAPGKTPTKAPAATTTRTATPEPTNTPRPTSTPKPTATPRPTNTPTPVPPTPTATPIPTPIVYTGSGDNVIEIQKPGDPDGAALLYVRGNAGSGYFGIESYDDAGNQVDLLVNTTDVYEGVVPLDFMDDEHTTRLQISADGDWYIEVRPLSMARHVAAPGTINGTGDDVFIVDGTPDTAHIVGNADGRYFGVIGYGDRYDLLVNTTDPYDGRVIVSGSTFLIEVNASGSWEITFE